MTSLLVTSSTNQPDFWYTISIAAGFIALGALGLEFRNRSYRGGVQSVIGAILSVLGIQFLVLFAEQVFLGEDVGLIKGALLAFILLTTCGATFLYYGHREHKNARSADTGAQHD